MGVYGITLHGSGKVRIVIKPHFIDPQMSEGGAGMEVSRMTCLHLECRHQPQKEKLALSLNERTTVLSRLPLGHTLTVTGVVGALQINWWLVLGSDGKRAPSISSPPSFPMKKDQYLPSQKKKKKSHKYMTCLSMAQL